MLTATACYAECLWATRPAYACGLVLSQICYWFEPRTARKNKLTGRRELDPRSAPIRAAKRKSRQKWVRGEGAPELWLRLQAADLGVYLGLSAKDVRNALGRLYAWGLVEHRRSSTPLFRKRSSLCLRPCWTEINTRARAAMLAAGAVPQEDPHGSP